jgi:hypothetical protein
MAVLETCIGLLSTIEDHAQTDQRTMAELTEPIRFGDAAAGVPKGASRAARECAPIISFRKSPCLST